jgi:hypothetical protein
MRGMSDLLVRLNESLAGGLKSRAERRKMTLDDVVNEILEAELRHETKVAEFRLKAVAESDAEADRKNEGR